MFTVNGMDVGIVNRHVYVAANHLVDVLPCTLSCVHCAELHAKYLKEKQRRKELHNALVVGYNCVVLAGVYIHL